MRVDVHAARRLRGADPVDLAAALLPVLRAVVEDDSVDLSRLRVVADWIQYRRNFRDVVEVRALDDGSGRFEIGVDLRRAADDDLTTLTRAAMADHRQGSRSRVPLEGFGPGRESCIWRFNELYWRHLPLWEAASGHDYEQALPGGESDARNRDHMRELVAELFAAWDTLNGRGALPEDLCIVELGVGNGNFARVFFEEFAALDAATGRDYQRRLHYFMGDYSPYVLEVAAKAVAGQAAHTSTMVLDARRPAATLGFLRGKVFLVYLSNVYDNLPTDEVATIDGRPYLVEARACLPRRQAEAIARSVGTTVDGLGALVARLLTLGPELLAEASPEHVPDRAAGVAFWMAVWDALRLEERYAPLDGIASYRPGGDLSGDLLRPFLYASGDTRMHVSNGTLTSFAETLPLLHPYGRLRCHDLFTVDHREYRDGFFGPGKYDGSVVNWVNGALLAHIGRRLGFDIRIEPFAQRPGANVKTLTAQLRD